MSGVYPSPDVVTEYSALPKTCGHLLGRDREGRNSLIIAEIEFPTISMRQDLRIGFNFILKNKGKTSYTPKFIEEMECLPLRIVHY